MNLTPISTTKHEEFFEDSPFGKDDKNAHIIRSNMKKDWDFNLNDAGDTNENDEYNAFNIEHSGSKHNNSKGLHPKRNQSVPLTYKRDIEREGVTCADCEEIYQIAISQNVPINNFICMKCRALINQNSLNYYKSNNGKHLSQGHANQNIGESDGRGYDGQYSSHSHSHTKNKLNNTPGKEEIINFFKFINR